MASKHLLRCRWSLAVTALLIISILANAQVSHHQNSRPTEWNPTPRMYDDPEIKVTIPKDWEIWSNAEIERSAPTNSLGNSIDQIGPGRLILEKNGYVLGLAYHTDHASGIEGGRFIEIFNIPWLDVDQAWTCGGYMNGYPYPASRNLVFLNLIVESGEEKVRENCGIQKDLGAWIEKDGKKQYDDGDRRWFGGYFITKYGGYFFGGNEDGCGLKAYTLTTLAKTAGQLPIANIPNQGNNPALEKIIQEAIDIVNSIQYKRCAPF
jgi:hypothetical protein